MDCGLGGMHNEGQTVNEHRCWMKKSKKKEDNEEEPDRFRRKDEEALAKCH